MRRGLIIRGEVLIDCDDHLVENFELPGGCGPKSARIDDWYDRAVVGASDKELEDAALRCAKLELTGYGR